MRSAESWLDEIYAANDKFPTDIYEPYDNAVMAAKERAAIAGMADVIRAIQQDALTNHPRQQWQDISTAKRDGTPVLLKFLDDLTAFDRPDGRLQEEWA